MGEFDGVACGCADEACGGRAAGAEGRAGVGGRTSTPVKPLVESFRVCIHSRSSCRDGGGGRSQREGGGGVHAN